MHLLVFSIFGKYFTRHILVDIARLLEYLKNISDWFRNILAILQCFQGRFLQRFLNLSVLCGYNVITISTKLPRFVEALWDPKNRFITIAPFHKFFLMIFFCFTELAGQSRVKKSDRQQCRLRWGRAHTWAESTWATEELLYPDRATRGTRVATVSRTI